MSSSAIPQPPSTTPKNSATTEVAKKNPFGDIKPEDLVVRTTDWVNLEEALFRISSPNGLKMYFLGAMLQGIQIDYSPRIGTACIQYIPNKKQFLIELNPVFFRDLSLDERMGVLLHELEHMMKLHLVRIPAFDDRAKANKAADCVINQFVPGIPTREPIRGIFPEDFNLPKDKSLEDYYNMWPDDQEGDEGDDNDGSGGQGGQGKGKKKGQGDVLDQHDWDNGADECDVLEGVDDAVKRTMIKTSTSFDRLPGSLKDLLDQIETKKKAIDWKRRLKSFIKKSASGIDRESTRTRPSKRYDYQSPGLKVGELPKLSIFIDTSGSMSIVEVNSCLQQVDEVLKAGMRKVKLYLWNTSCYAEFNYKKGMRDFIHKQVESGGTDFQSCSEIIEKSRPDGCIVLTDGYFSDTKTKVQCPILFVITNGGAKELPTSYVRQSMISLPNMG